MVEWDYFDKFHEINVKYLPSMGEGDNMATQAVTAVNKLIYKWYNDGDVFDTTGDMHVWGNDLSHYANWLRKYTGVADILDRVYGCKYDPDYEELLKALADKLLNEEVLAPMALLPKVDSVYEAEGPYKLAPIKARHYEMNDF